MSSSNTVTIQVEGQELETNDVNSKNSANKTKAKPGCFKSFLKAIGRCFCCICDCFICCCSGNFTGHTGGSSSTRQRNHQQQKKQVYFAVPYRKHHRNRTSDDPGISYGHDESTSYYDGGNDFEFCHTDYPEQHHSVDHRGHCGGDTGGDCGGGYDGGGD